MNSSDKSFAQSLSETIENIKTKHQLMGGIVITFCKDQILNTVPFGKADYERDINVKENTIFRVASISKTITAIATMQLVERGLLNLDDPISNILGFEVRNPKFPDIAITSQMLLTHTSSFIDGDTYDDFLEATYFKEIANIRELISESGKFYIKGQFLDHEPGTYFTYCNLNYGILGTIIEKVSNTRFDIYCKENIFDKMNINASFNINDIKDINLMAGLYRKPDNIWMAQYDKYNGQQPVFENLSNYEIGKNGLRFGPQGGLRISGPDLAKIFSLFLNDGKHNNIQILSKESIHQMVSQVWKYKNNNGNDYNGLFKNWGLGIHRITNLDKSDIIFSNKNLMIGHAGDAYGLISDAYVDQEKNYGFIFITNGSGKGYSSGKKSAFFSVEEEIFDAIEAFGALHSCN